MRSGLYWLASYPKSGNTWLRVFLSNLQANQEEAVSINLLSTAAMASNRDWLNDVLGFSTTELYRHETLALRPMVYEQAHQEAVCPLICKAHDANIEVAGATLFSPQAMVKTIYVVRNPLDIAVSLANHLGVSVSRAVNNICDPHFTLINHNYRQQVPQPLLTWGRHVESWLDHQDLPIHVIRYEDMHTDSYKIFSEIATFLDINHEAPDIVRAIKNSSFEVLQRQESMEPFYERPPTSKAFFRNGRIGEWRDVLTNAEVGQIVAVNHSVMERFGYLDSDCYSTVSK